MKTLYALCVNNNVAATNSPPSHVHRVETTQAVGAEPFGLQQEAVESGRRETSETSSQYAAVPSAGQRIARTQCPGSVQQRRRGWWTQRPHVRPLLFLVSVSLFPDCRLLIGYALVSCCVSSCGSVMFAARVLVVLLLCSSCCCVFVGFGYVGVHARPVCPRRYCAARDRCRRDSADQVHSFPFYLSLSLFLFCLFSLFLSLPVSSLSISCPFVSLSSPCFLQ